MASDPRQATETRLCYETENCPYCGADFRYGPNGEYSKLIAIYSRERDKTVAYRCPNCGKEDERDE